MKDISTPVPPHEVRAVIKKSLENAALVNYERLSEEAKVEGNFPGNKPQQSSVIFLFQSNIFASRACQPPARGHDRRGGGAARPPARGPHQAGRAVRGSAEAERGVLRGGNKSRVTCHG